MTGIVIRRVCNADRPAVAALRAEWTRERDGDAGDAGFDARFAEWFEQVSAQRIGWLAEAGGRAVGMVHLAVFERMPSPVRPPSRWGYLANAFVLAEYRNQGVGGRLLDALLDYADEHDFVRVLLNPSQRAIPFYTRAGFGPASALLVRTPPETRPSRPASGTQAPADPVRRGPAG